MEATISRKDLQGRETPATISDVQHVASYNWMDSSDDEPTIVVPGIPPRWQSPVTPTTRRLPKDSGLVYIAQNAARHPDSPMEPLFRAVYEEDPTFDMRKINVVTDRNNLRKLLSFVDPPSSRNVLEAFTIHVEVVGESTVILSRVETKTYEIIGPKQFVGFGHEFEKAYTTCEINNSTGHHRVISYNFGGLRYAVRYEVDGYVDEESENPVAQLTSKIDGLSLASSKKAATGSSKLLIGKQGRVVPTQSILEIKTRSAHKPISIDVVAPQLWIAQTPKLVRASHNHGLFLPPHVKDVADQIAAWERNHQASLKKLAALMTKITELVRGFGGSSAISYDKAANELVVRKMEGKPMLPPDLYSKWEKDDES